MATEAEITLTTKTQAAEILALLKQQGIYDLDTLVKKSLEAAPQALGLTATSASHGCVFVCSPSGHGYVYVVIEQ